MKKITKAVIPAAGMGTRMLPIARTIPKEVLPIVDRPAIAYLVEEAKKSGVTDILIITSRGKGAIEDYFDLSPEYETRLKEKGKDKQITAMREAWEGLNIHFIRQHESKGLGHAILCAEAFTGSDPFFVLYGDDIILSEMPVCLQMEQTYQKYGKPVAGVGRVSDEQVMKYCTLDAAPIDGSQTEFLVKNMIEKPKKEEIITNLAILGRVLLTPEIFDVLRSIPYGAGGELQLTDALTEISKRSGTNALLFEGTRYDMGSKIGFMKANIETGLKHPEIGGELRCYLQELVRNF